jgi:hypothetical protein
VKQIRSLLVVIEVVRHAVFDDNTAALLPSPAQEEQQPVDDGLQPLQ